MSILAFYFDIVRALEEIGAPYMLIGAFAGSGLGISRATFDIDMVVDLQEPHFEALASRFPPPRYYADPEQMRSSTRWGMIALSEWSQKQEHCGVRSSRGLKMMLAAPGDL
jgi:hypothetical protein